MPDLPARFATIIVAFAPLFRHRTWHHAEILLVGAILAPGKRTVTSILRITGLSRERNFVNFHRVLSRARWSGREAARLLLGLLIHAFAPTGPVILGLDDTIERRRGKHIKAKGIYRDPVRSSDAHFVKASGLRWISLMLLAPIPWAARTWALPFLTALAPSERYCGERGQRHKKLTDWARQMVLQVRRWLPARELVLVTDMGFAALEPRRTVLRYNSLDRWMVEFPAYLNLPHTLDHGSAEFPSSRLHRPAGGTDGFHELVRGLMPDGTVRPFAVVLESERLAF